MITQLTPGTRLGPYEILELRGKGGMGEVYRARDTRLGRDVAVKVLPAAMSEDPQWKRRFDREARAISRLQHPNVCMLHDVGAERGIEYLVMEYLEGESLEERLRRGPLPIADALRIGCEIADGLEAAHRQGIVHRDLKPGNVLLSRTGTKVVDFGVAREVAPHGAIATEAATLEAFTEDGRLAGTLPYMAPEQLDGRPATPRTDIWALGCVLHEMTTAERPFRGEGRSSLIAAIAAGHVEPVRSRRPDAPERLDWVIRRCLEHDPLRRWQDARDVRIALESIDEPSELAAGNPRAAVTPVAESGGLAFGRRATVTGLFVIVLAAALGVWRWRAAGGRDASGPIVADLPLPGTVAVLPFANLTGDTELDQVAGGVAEEVILRLFRIWPVIDRNRSFAHAGKDPCAAAAALKISFVLDGSVRAAADRLRVSAHLFRCPDRAQLWTRSYDQPGMDPLALQEEVAASIVGEVQQVLWTSVTNPAIPGSILFYLKRSTREDNQRALELVKAAVAATPNVATWTAYSNAHQQKLREGWWEDPEEVVREIERAARGYCESSRGTWGCHLFTAWASFWGGSPEELVPEMELALEASEGLLPIVHALLGQARALTGDPAAGLANVERAIELSSDDASMSWILQCKTVTLFAAADYEGARDAAQRSLRLPQSGEPPATTHLHIAASLAHLGRLEEARASLDEARRLRPALRREVVSVHTRGASRDYRERYLEGLRLAGLRE